ncbi:hypothetical protein Y032_0008g81 [Ancylostoma ceylanicum]|uniref:Uncharacterized protein n=1 Tax=Ancylostoma ceylanicum TaxID=53326 RepID=A0A016VLJ9_9BILA|nr:hypothetical protein Y032_0008g81 [Ancylostoma ceylanicum]
MHAGRNSLRHESIASAPRPLAGNPRHHAGLHDRWRRVQRTGRLSVAEEELPAYLAQYSNADAGQSEADRVVVAGQSKRVLSSWLAMCTPSRWNTQETVEYQNTLVLATI